MQAQPGTLAAAAAEALPPHSNNVDEEMQRVRLALEAVFSTSSSSAATNVQQQEGWFTQRQLADRYLTSFQTHQISWMVCDRLLQDGNEQQGFFAAQTLHTKCRLDVHELPPESLPSLRDSLLAHLNRYAAVTAPSAALLTQLALAISALAVQMGWTTIVSDLLTNQASHPMLLLSILTVLPEECASDRLFLRDENTRYAVRDHLVASAPHVFAYLEAQAQQQTARVLQVFWSWIRWVPVHPSSLLDCPLLKMSIQALHQTQFLESAADIVVEVLRMYPSHVHGNEGLVKWLIPILLQLPIQDALRSGNEDVLRAYCRIVTEMGESYMSSILSPSHDHVHERALVESVLQCSTIRSLEIASITLHFWYRMIMDLECIDPYEWREELIHVYEPQILRLIDVCVTGLMKYPADIDDLPEDMVEDLHRHRFYVTETVEDCCRLLGGRVILQRLGDMFQGEVQRLGATPPHQAEWQGVESCLACIAAIHRFVPTDEAVLLPQCFKLIPQLRQDIKPLRFTASKAIGKFAAWLSMHPDLLQPLLPFLAEGLDLPECAPAAAVAIKELCQCSNHSFIIVEPVMRLYQCIIDTGNSKHLELQDELEILEGLCKALSRQIMDRRSNGAEVLISLANPIGSRLAAAISNPSSTSRRITPELDRLTTIVQYLTITPADPNVAHPVIDLMSSTWSLLEQSIRRFPADNMLAEKICRLHKHALRSVGAKHYIPVLDALMNQLVTSFELTKQSPYLYAASIVIAEYGENPTYSPKLFEMVVSMAATAFAFLRNMQDMTNHPDVVEELFYLASRAVSSFAERLVSSALLTSLFQSAIVAIQLDHHRANRGTFDFLDKILSFGLSLRERSNHECQAALEAMLTNQGAELVHNLARALMGDLPTYSNHIPELLWKLNLLCPSLLAQWLASAFGSASLPERAKNDFIGALHTNLARDEFSLAASAFQSACARERRFRTTRRT